MKAINEGNSLNDVMLEKVIKTIDDNEMIKYGDGIVVGLSGGPDSMCLLHVLYQLKDRYGLKLYAAHINHMLRGEAADEDQKACEDFCSNLGVKCYVLRADINSIAESKGVSTEMAGRDVRYDFFNDVMEKTSSVKIAVAHNMNDQAETILMHMMRGTGLDGLVGIRPVRGNRIIRPIVKITRNEIEEYCQLNELPVRIDKTNLEPVYSRNKVRLELIPYIQKNFNPDIISSLARMGELVSKDEEYMQETASKVFQKYCYIREEKVIIYKDVFTYHPSIISRVIRKAIFKVKGNVNNIQSVHIDNIINLQKCNTGKFTKVPGNIIINNVYGDIVISIDVKKKPSVENSEFSLQIGKNYIESMGITVNIANVNKDNISYKNGRGKRYFSIDGVNEITLRNRREGDRFTPLGLSGSKKLKDVFINLKIPREERDTIPLLCFDQSISWIVGYGISDKYKVNNKTQNVIEVSVERQETYE